MIPGLEKHKYLYNAIYQLQTAMEGSEKPNYREAAIQLRSIATRLIHYYFVKNIPAFMGKRVDDEQAFPNHEKSPGKLLDRMRDYRIREEREIQWLDHCITQGNYAAHPDPEKTVLVDDTIVNSLYEKLDEILSGFLNEFPSDEKYTDPLRGTVTITRRNQYFDKKQNRKYPALIADYKFENANFSDENSRPNTNTYWFVDGSLVSRSFQLEIDDSVANKEITCYVSSKENDGAVWAANQPFIIKADNKRQGKVVVEVDPTFKGTQKTPAGVRLEAKLTHNGINILDERVLVTWYAINTDGTFRELFKNSGAKGGNRFVCSKERSLGQAYHCVVSFDGKTWSGDSPKLTESDFEIKGTVVIRPKYSIEKGKTPFMMLKASVQDGNYQGQPIYTWERDGVILADTQDSAVIISKNDIGAVYTCRIHHPGLVGERLSEPHCVENKDFDALEKKLSDLNNGSSSNSTVNADTITENKQPERDIPVKDDEKRSVSPVDHLAVDMLSAVNAVQKQSEETTSPLANRTGQAERVQIGESRSPLSNGDRLSLNGKTIVIQKEIGRGGSCIVYRGVCEDPTDRTQSKTVIVKEFYPASVAISRGENECLNLKDAKQSESFEKQKEQFCKGLTSHSRYYEYYLDKSLPRVFDFGEANGTVYAVSDPSKAESLSQIDFNTLSLPKIASIMEEICKAIGRIHQKKKLYLDIKPDNFFYILGKEDLQARIYLFDFNTIIDEEALKIGEYSFCTASSEWAPPEQQIMQENGAGYGQYRDPAHIGMHTDIYSVGAVCFWLLTERNPSKNDLEQIQAGLFDWGRESRFCYNAEPEVLSVIQETMAKLLQPDATVRENFFSEHTVPIREVEKLFKLLYGYTAGDDPHFAPIHQKLSKLEAAIEKLNLISREGTGSAAAVKPSVSSKEIGFSNYEELLHCKGDDVPVQYRDGSTYVGGWRFGVRHGFGRYTSADGKQTYVGDYVLDRRNGQGILTDEDLGEYNGPWLDDKMHGYDGEMTYKDGRWYKGDWENGLRSGKGKCKGKSGNTYIGDFINDQACGYGTIQSSTGEILYEGYNIDGVPNGEGTIYHPDGRVYHGPFKSGKPHGRHGVMTYKNKDVYDGDWDQGIRRGTGKYTFASGLIYDGEWDDNARNGHGTLIYKNGDIFEGEFKNGKRNGDGEIRYPNGDVRKGTWKEDKEEGDIIFTHSKSGIAFISTYIDGVLQKKGKIVYSEKEYYYGDLVDFRKDGIGEYHYANGNVFQGSWKNGKKQGAGKMILPDGSVFEGEWIDDVVQETGKLTIPNKGTYIGPCVDFIPNGEEGTFVYLNGDTYVGCWRNGKRYDEEGIMYYANKDKYVGNWADDEINGKGRMEYADGSTYEGGWKHSQYNGYGIYVYSNKCIYKGNWVDGKKQDENGDQIWPDGEHYHGCFVKGKYHGYGELVFSSGAIYKGKWENSKRQDENGDMIWPDGKHYHGGFVNGKFNGYGVMTWKSGHRYAGYWKDNKYSEGELTDQYGNVYIGKFINGKKNDDKGTMRFADKGEYVGSWVDDIRSGHGTMTFPNGDVYDGMFEGDKPNGHGIMQSHGGKIYDGQWKNGLQNGKGTETEDGYVRTGQFVNGKKVGTFWVYQVSYSANKYKVEYKDGRSTLEPKDNSLKPGSFSTPKEKRKQSLEDTKNKVLMEAKQQEKNKAKQQILAEAKIALFDEQEALLRQKLLNHEPVGIDLEMSSEYHFKLIFLCVMDDENIKDYISWGPEDSFEGVKTVIARYALVRQSGEYTSISCNTDQGIVECLGNAINSTVPSGEGEVYTYEDADGQIHGTPDYWFAISREALPRVALPEKLPGKKYVVFHGDGTWSEAPRETLTERIGRRLTTVLSKEELKEFDSISDTKEVAKWLESHVPNYLEIVREEKQREGLE